MGGQRDDLKSINQAFRVRQTLRSGFIVPLSRFRRHANLGPLEKRFPNPRLSSNLKIRKVDSIDTQILEAKPDLAVVLRIGLQSAFLVAWLGSFQYGFSQEFRAGTAKAKITPEELGWLGGYGHRNRPAEGVAADLWSRALALEDKLGHRRVLVSTDIHIFTRSQHREIAEAVRKRHGIEERDLMLIATHTHSGPALPRGFDPGISWGLNQDEMRKLHAASDRVREQTLDAIARALSDLQPARLSFGRGRAVLSRTCFRV